MHRQLIVRSAVNFPQERICACG